MKTLKRTPYDFDKDPLKDPKILNRINKEIL